MLGIQGSGYHQNQTKPPIIRRQGGLCGHQGEDSAEIMQEKNGGNAKIIRGKVCWIFRSRENYKKLECLNIQ